MKVIQIQLFHIVSARLLMGLKLYLSSDMLQRDVKAVDYFTNDVPCHLPDCNRNSVNLMSDGVTPDKLLHLTFQKGNSEPVLGSLVDHMSTLWNEEEKKVNGSLLDRNVTLSYEFSCVDSNFQGTEKNIDLQDSECLDASSTGNHTEVDVSTDQEMKKGFVDESTLASCFEPAELLKHIRLLAVLPSVGCDGQLQLTTSKAQVAAYSQFQVDMCPLPDFHVCYGLLESDANNSRLSDGIQGHDDVAESLTPRKKGRSTSELIGEMPKVDGKEERELDIRDSSVTASACRKRSRKRKAFESLVNSSGKRQVNFAAKVSSSASQEPNKSFKVGECLSQLRLAAQDPVRRYSFLNEITTFFSGFRQFVISQFGEATSQLVPSETDKPVRSGQRSLKRFSSGKQVMVAKEPVVDHMDIRSSDCLLSEADNSIKSGQRSRKRFSRGKQVLVAKEPVVDHMDIKSSDCSPSEADKPIKSGQRSRKRFSSGKQVMVAKEPVVDYMDIRSSDCLPSEADNPIKSGQRSRKRFSSGKQVLVAEEPVVDHMDIRSSDCSPSKADKPVKSGQRSRKRFSSGKQLMVAEEPVVDYMDIRSSDSSPTGLILKFNEGKSVPSELTLNKIFRRFGPLWEHETEIDRESSSAKVVYKRCSDAEVAFSSAGVFNIFGSILVSYELSYSRSAPFKTLPDATGQDQKAAN
ncbi:uncharacterized protein LOC141696270 [Apium graveolens]|uniref:uncharacterized protein LOC141696270 n=1 Tax=Apium graveolens TaxID=4045 RepID=UPI003D7BF542